MMRASAILPLFAALLLPLAASASPLSPEARAAIDKAAAEVLARTGAPSASIAIVKDGAIVYEQAYGLADVEKGLKAAPTQRYSIGSVSKQFTAVAALLLVEEGKLSLDDRVVRFLPALTRAKDVTVRQLLSMTAGYQDFWPQDYVMPRMLEPATVQEILDGWGKKPLDFEPGTRWQYSNTNYVIAGAIVEKAAGMPLLDLLKARVFTKLGMESVADSDQTPLGAGEPRAYQRHGLGPVRPAPKEGRGWMFAAGELAMTAHDLALWNASIIDRTVLQPASYLALETAVPLASGVSSGYALGLSAALKDQRRVLAHGGEVSGFTALNQVFPDERAAITVLVNLDATNATEQLGKKIAEQLFAATDPATTPALEKVKAIFAGLQKGAIDRGLLTSNASAYFTPQALKDLAAGLGPLGAPESFTQSSQALRGGMTVRRYQVKFKPAKTVLRIVTLWMPGDLLEQYMVSADE